MHRKENHQQNEKATYWVGENVCKLCYLIRGYRQRINTTQQKKTSKQT